MNDIEELAQIENTLDKIREKLDEIKKLRRVLCKKEGELMARRFDLRMRTTGGI